MIWIPIGLSLFVLIFFTFIISATGYALWWGEWAKMLMYITGGLIVTLCLVFMVLVITYLFIMVGQYGL